jgi:diaminohydroxyphosphoribosylaminopyrimidine deaminase / 5-amino-6-(5-phosphoribosylamino)uracil reductase
VSASLHLPPAIADAFRKAVSAAQAFRGATSPNPPVGCVLLDEARQVLAVAAHERAGQPHAEALAIASCRHSGTVHRIVTAVVTLEPCNHTGRTPPCTEALLATPVREVWIGCRDPNPRVKGGGADALKADGRMVHFLGEGDIQHACADLIRPFSKYTRTGLPWVTVKQALTSDNGMIPPAGQKTFTSADSLRMAHELRKRADAILTGSGTILADDPHFTVRHVLDFPDKRRALAFLDRRKRIPNTYISAAVARGFDVCVFSSIEDALRGLGSKGVLEVLVEAGPTVTRAVLASDHWDEHIVIHKNAVSAEPDIIRRTLNRDRH